MGIVDILLMGLILGGAVYLLYYSLWRKKGHCPGCDSSVCHANRPPGNNACFTEKSKGK